MSSQNFCHRCMRVPYLYLIYIILKQGSFLSFFPSVLSHFPAADAPEYRTRLARATSTSTARASHGHRQGFKAGAAAAAAAAVVPRTNSSPTHSCHLTRGDGCAALLLRRWRSREIRLRRRRSRKNSSPQLLLDSHTCPLGTAHDQEAGSDGRVGPRRWRPRRGPTCGGLTAAGAMGTGRQWARWQ
jgi:hypothetical protein